MAEGWARHLKADVIEAYSAGTQPQGLNPWAVRVMQEAGVDISGHQSKHVQDLLGVPFDFVVTVCDDARETCPVFPGRATRIHMSFPDPPRLARDASSEEEVLRIYREVRDAIRRFVETLPEALIAGQKPAEAEPFSSTA